MYGQLESGGWTQVIQLAPGPRLGKYRHGHGGDWNASTLDDGQTQSALCRCWSGPIGRSDSSTPRSTRPPCTD